MWRDWKSLLGMQSMAFSFQPKVRGQQLTRWQLAISMETNTGFQETLRSAFFGFWFSWFFSFSFATTSPLLNFMDNENQRHPKYSPSPKELPLWISPHYICAVFYVESHSDVSKLVFVYKWNDLNIYVLLSLETRTVPLTMTTPFTHVM